MRSKVIARWWFSFLLAAGAFSARLQAHPGHDLFDSTPQHLLSSPYHLLCLALLGGGLLLAARLTRKPSRRKLLAFAGCCFIGAGILAQML